MTEDETQGWADARLQKVLWLLVVDPDSVLPDPPPPPMAYRTLDRALMFANFAVQQLGGKIVGYTGDDGWPLIKVELRNGRLGCTISPVLAQFELPPI